MSQIVVDDSKMKRVQTSPSHWSASLPRKEDVERLRSLTAPHVESYNYFLEEGLSRGIKSIEPAEFAIIDPQKQREDPDSIELTETTTVKFWVEDAGVDKPVKGNPGGKTRENLFPRECRERSMMYSGPLTAVFCCQVIKRRNGIENPDQVVRIPKEFGDLPIMIGSKACHLQNATPKQLSLFHEEVSSRACIHVNKNFTMNISDSLSFFLALYRLMKPVVTSL